jgi:hypothetical protein
MPHGKDGRPFEALLNPLGIISRTNPAQMVEAALGKIAERTGTPYVVHDFDPNTNLTMFAKQELARHGMTDTETIVDPATGREIPNIFTGNRFLMKLHHTAEGKSDSRSTGSYSSEGAPTKGAGGNSKRLSLMDMNALLSHGATSVIREAGAIRGQASPDYWQQVMSGYDPPAPREPVVYAKFLDMLRASGINPVREGTKLHLMALTDRDIETLAGNRHPENAETVDWKAGLKPIKGGLFSPDLVGDGSRWAAIPLHEPMPSPAFEEPIRRLLGLTESRFRAVLAGREALGDHGTGPGGLKSALAAIDLDQAIAQARADFKAGRASTRDAAARKLGYLKTAKRQGLHPADWIWSKVPVLPAKFRPVSVMAGSGLPMVSDANILYREVFDANDNLRELSGQVEDTGAEREALYDAIKGVVGLGDPIHPKNQERQVKGILRSVFAHSPKYGCYDETTEILTHRGWIAFPELVEDDTVATLNPHTGTFEWQQPEAVQRYRYVGEMVRLQTKRGLDLLLTPTHRNWVRSRAKGRTADDIESGWGFQEAGQTAASRNRIWFRTAASGWSGHRRRPRWLPKTCRLIDFAGFVGWWTAEGWLGDRKLDCVQICQAIKQEMYCKEIDRLVRALGLPYSVGKYRKKTPSRKGYCWVWQWSIRSADMAAWLDRHVQRGASTKSLSRKILDWDMPYLTEFYLGYARGDGNKRQLARRNDGGVTHKNASPLNDEHHGYSTTSPRLADQLVEICCKLGMTAKGKWRPGRNERENPLHRACVSGSRFVVTAGSAGKSFEWYDGYVYCCTVPNGIVLVRRNGRPVFSGNSVQRKLIGSSTDLVGRAVIAPDPDLGMDEIGLPEASAWETYRPFVVRRLVRGGVPRLRAARAVADREPMARQALLEETQSRPVLVNRAPTLHRYSIMALRPKLVTGDTLRLPPLIYKGMGADNDGDAVNYHVLASEDASREALEKMLPSKNLLSAADFKVHQLPSQEYISGLFNSSSLRDDHKPARRFATSAEAVAAYRRGELSVGDPVDVLDDR